MTAERAVALLRELQIGLRSATVRELSEATGEAPTGAVVRARGARYEVVLELADGALAGLAAHDAERAIALLEGAPGQA